MTFVSELEPTLLWGHFDAILEIPRGSKNEEQIRQYVLSVAKRNGLDHKIDATGNVVVYKPASSGKEGAKTTVLQGHLDMVNEKNSDVEHDFEKDPIKPVRDGEFLKASGTTLGSDNGIGVAAMLAVMEDQELTHPPLEFLFTMDEETGLTGASNLADGLLHGRQLINLDSEEEGVLTIGCAGGGDTHLSFPINKEAAPAGSLALHVKLFGLKGGHSGIDAHLQRGNAVKLLTRALYSVSLDQTFRLVDLAGGNMHNAIPREAHATVALDSGAAAAFRSGLQDRLNAIREEFKPAEPDMAFSIDDVDLPAESWSAESTLKAMAFVTALPHGVMSMSYDIPGLVETSTNLAVVSEEGGKLKVHMSSRSSVESAIQAIKDRIRAAGVMAGAAVSEHDGYPGWKPDVSSRMLEVVKQVHEQVTGKKPEVGAVHAGLECGIIGEKYPGMDMISFGPTIQFPHSPDECVEIATVGRFYALLGSTLERLAG